MNHTIYFLRRFVHNQPPISLSTYFFGRFSANQFFIRPVLCYFAEFSAGWQQCFSLKQQIAPRSLLRICPLFVLGFIHRNHTTSRKGANIISRRPSHGHLARRCCPQAFLRIFSEVTYIRTVGNSTLLKIYTLPNHTNTIGMCILETQLGCPAKLVSIRNNRN
jgi:hypothetical protein